MATIKLAVLRHTKAKDGSYKIRISIGHKSETHYIVTRYRVRSLANFVNGTVVGQPDANYINVKLRQLLNEYDSRLDKIPNPGDLTCSQLRDILKGMQSGTASQTLLAVANDYLTILRRENRNSYAKILEYMVQKFLRYTNGDIYLSNITTSTIDGYCHYLSSQGVKATYQTMCLVNIRTLINRAIKMQMVRYDVHPFLYWKATRSEPRELDIPVQDLRKLMDYRTPYKSRQRAVDFFMLSYYLGGMNLVDMIAYDFRGYKDNPVLSYVRHKTANKNGSNHHVEFTIQPEAYPIIDKYMNTKTGHILNIKESQYRSTLNYIDLALRKAASELDIEHTVSFYTARKSFVQHGFELGIPLETLEYCIGQTMKANRPIFNYVKIMRQHADVAIRQILDNLKTAET
jgi:site-specific recombinase XerD